MSDSDGWVVDRGLLVLRDQIDAAAPNRSKDSDGTIGDAAHAARDSDHNPESPPPAGNPDRQVDALDVTHDPAHGADMAVVSEAIRASHDVRVRYIIFARRIAYPTARNGFAAWAWQPYSGSDPHTGHMHVSVNDVHHDETQPWAIGVGMNWDDPINGTINPKRTFRQVLQDLSNERDWRYGHDGTKTANPPGPDSRAQQLVDSAQRAPVAADVAAFKAALTDPEALKLLAKAINDDAAARMAS